MKISVLESPKKLGETAADLSASIINDAINKKGKARICLSTGASQFETLASLIKKNIDWSKVEMFHLDEYINLPESHPASFRHYLKERFIQHINLRRAYLVDGENDVQTSIDFLSREINKEPIDLALIGIGENAHIAFNDPPADFDTKEAFIVVNLDEDCKLQQVSEGWFSSPESVPSQAISMSVHQILQSNSIISCVPHQAKAHAVKLTLESEVSNNVPATILKNHPNFNLFLDKESASSLENSILSEH